MSKLPRPWPWAGDPAQRDVSFALGEDYHPQGFGTTASKPARALTKERKNVIIIFEAFLFRARISTTSSSPSALPPWGLLWAITTTGHALPSFGALISRPNAGLCRWPDMVVEQSGSGSSACSCSGRS
eukprot:3014979-Prymnesium_polylepis.1